MERAPKSEAFREKEFDPPHLHHVVTTPSANRFSGRLPEKTQSCRVAPYPQQIYDSSGDRGEYMRGTGPLHEAHFAPRGAPREEGFDPTEARYE